MNRKLCLGAVSLLSCAGCVSAAEESRPNVLFIVLDDAGYNDFGFMGSQDLETPNIDRLAERGTIFTDAHVTASVSGPSRSGVLTGRYQQRNGYECNLGSSHLGTALDETTVADIFAEAGYGTSCIGKWHQGNGAEYHPNARGFDHFFGFIAGSRSYFYNPKGSDSPKSHQRLQLNGVDHKFEGYLTDVLADGAIDYMKQCQQEDRPFMSYLAFNAVHTPMQATEEDLARYEGHPRKLLAAMTWAVDRAIGSVVEYLEQSGQFDNTLIFFISDNGGAYTNTSNNYPLKGFKGNKFEGGIRIPYFVVYGDRLTGDKYDGLTSTLDMLPTAAAAAGIDLSGLEKPLDGVNLIPYITGEQSGEPHDILFWRKDRMAAVRMGEYKVIRVEGVGTRMYDVESSFDESDDLQESHPQRYAEMIERLEQWETELVNPLYWNEGDYVPVTTQIHKDLMENRAPTCFSPAQYKKKYGTITE